MAKTLAPTKGNLMMAKNTLRLSKQGYEMLDKKRNILIREMMLLIEEAKEVEAKIEETFAAAYKALESANVIMGVSKVQNLAHSAVLENSVKKLIYAVLWVLKYLLLRLISLTADLFTDLTELPRHLTRQALNLTKLK